MVEIRLKNIKKMFGDFTAVENVNLSIHEGEILTLLGPSGCGKTTILRMIAGLIFPTEGEIWFDDNDVTHVPTQERNTALVFQNYALFPHMSVRKNVEYGLTLKKVPKEERQKRVEEVLRLVKMERFSDRMPGKLSGGQQQRVALARALVVNPDVLLLDEPLSNLDAKLRVETRHEIRDLVKRLNLTTIFVTHDQAEALAISDKIAVMEIGHVRQVGTPTEIWEHPETAFVGSFIGEANSIDMNVEEIHEDHVKLSVPSDKTQVIKSTYFKGITNIKDPARMVVRPERIIIKKTREPKSNCIEATVKTVQFFGKYNLVLATLTNGTDITVYESNMIPLNVGETIYLEINPQDAKAFGPNNF